MKNIYANYLPKILLLFLMLSTTQAASAQCLFTATASAGSTGCGTTQLYGGPSGNGTSILFSEDFESYTVGIVTPSTSPWKGYWLGGFADTWWAMVNCAPISGSRSMSLYNSYWGTYCDYDDTYSFSEVSYHQTMINATGYTNLRMNFKWKGYAEPGFDYAQVAYSLNGTSWTVLPTQYAGQSSTQTVTNLDLSALNGQQFYIGFRWLNDSYAYNTPFMVDDITITGDKAYTYAWSGPAGTVFSPSSTAQNPTVNKSGTYTLSVTSGTCTSTATTSATVDPVPSTASSISVSTTSLCSGGSVTVTRNGTTNGQDRWWMSRDGVHWTEFSDGYAGQQSWTRTLTVPGVYQVYHHPWGGACGWDGWTHGRYSSTITVYEQPTITLSGNNQSICSGGNASAFSASISGGSGCGYQWQASNDGINWTDISGATGSSYTPTGLTKSTFYRCRTRNCVTSCNQATSQVRFVAVTPAPVVQTHPSPSSQSVCEGVNISYSSQANIGSGTTRYRLVLTSAYGTSWHGIQEILGYNASGVQQTLTCLGASSATYTDDICPSAAYGAANAFDGVYNTTTSNGVQWLTPKNHPAGNTNWENYFNVNPFYSPEWIEWSSPQPLAEVRIYNGRYQSGSSSTNYKDYYILVSYDNGVTWNKVKEGTMNNAQGFDGTNNYINIEPDYTWKRGSTTVGTGKDLIMNSVTTGNTGTYTVQMNYGCATTTSNSASLTVGEQPAITISGANNVCSGGSVTLTAAATGGSGTCTFQWQYWTGTGWSNTGSNSATLNTGALSVSRIYRCIRSCSGGSCVTATSNEHTVTVDAAPTIRVQPESADACPGGSVTLTVEPALDWTDPNIWNFTGNITWDAGQQAWKCTGYCTMYLKTAYAPPVNSANAYNIEVDVLRTVNQSKLFYWGGRRLNSSMSQLSGYGGSYDYSATRGGTYPPIGEWKTYQAVGKTGTSANFDGWGSGADETFYYRVGGLINYSGSSSEVTYIRNIKFYYNDVHYFIDNPVSYQWKKNGSNIGGANGASYTMSGVSAANAGTYTVAVSNTCGTTQSEPAAVIVNPAPTTPSISVTNGSTTGCGSINATLEASSSIAGNALSVNGSSSYNLGNPAALQITGDMTIEMWLKPANFSQRRNPYGKAYGGEGTITQETNGTLNFYWGQGAGNAHPYTGFNSATPLTLNQWNHIAIVRDMTGNSVRWYINGVQTNSMTPPYAGSVSGNTATIGLNYTGQGYMGEIDEVRIWTTARSTAEIQANMNTVVAPFQSNLAGYWRMDETSGTITDASGSNTVSTATGSPAFVTSGAPIEPDYSWSPTTQLSPTTGKTVVTTATTSRTYTVTASSAVSCGSANNSIAVTVNPYPVISVQPANQTACNSEVLSITASVSGATGYQWEFRSSSGGTWGNITNGNGNYPGYLSSVSGATTSALSLPLTPASNAWSGMQVRLKTTSAAGCVTYSNPATITVNPASTAEAGGPNTVCQSSSPAAITLSGASVGGGATTGAWSIISGGGSLSSTAQTGNPAAVTYTPAANFSGTVTLRLISNAQSGCSAVTDDRTINVTALPAASASNAGPYCVGSTISLSTTNVSGASYSWSGPGGYTASGRTPTRTNATTAMAGTYTVTVTANGCSKTSSTTVTVNQPSVAAVNAAISPRSISAGNYLWVGNANSNWSNAANWYEYNGSNFQLATTPPASTDVVYILPNSTGSCISGTSPTINATANANDVYIGSGAVLNSGAGQTLNISGDYSNYGIFNASTGIVNFNGAGNQTLLSGWTSGNTNAFNRLYISNSGGTAEVNVTGNMKAITDIQIQQGTLDIQNNNVYTPVLNISTTGKLNVGISGEMHVE